ncbi:MAG: flavohemoglobin expression-modulating QEGLA motif protein, partial [Luteimonas sp.]|nr:flavohemoglobin expression-modulating QEGLA motif protein [Luteimonas sp.]
MTLRPPDIAHHAVLDARMVAAARGIRLLTLVSWPAEVQQRFLDQHARGHDLLPEVAYPVLDFSDARREFDAIAATADPAHPIGAYLIESTRSWSIAAQLLESLGTPAVGAHSIALFGRPDEPLPGNGPTAREAARHFIDIANELDRELLSPAEQVTISATALQMQLQADLDRYFGERVIAVELDPDMIAKAAAGARRIRLRSGAEYTDYDHHQLLQHEAFVHSLTALNGREQTVLGSLSLS